MDLQERKIYFVQEFLRLNNETVIAKFEHILQTEKKEVVRSIQFCHANGRIGCHD